MINIYDAGTQNFNNNGLAILSPTFCEVAEELNGPYELELEHPYDAREKWRYLEEGNIIKAPTQDGPQLFRIYKKYRTLSGVSVYARHIFYDLEDNFLEDVRPTNLNGQAALEWILNGTQYPHRFIVLSDITYQGTKYFVRINPVEAIMKDVIDVWGGELIRDNFTIKLMQNRGQDRGVTIRYGKNLTGIQEEISLDSVVTRIMPQGYDGLFLPEKYIDSPLLNNYPHPKIRKLEYSDIKVDEENSITEAMALDELRDAAEREYSVNKIDIPPANYKVNFVELSKTEEYKQYSVLETVKLGDMVTIKHEKYGFNLKAKVIRTVYDSIALRVVSTELGSFKENMGGAYQKIANELGKIADIIVETKSDFQIAIDYATSQITGALGGYVVLRPKNNPSEILIMDTPDVNTAQKVWRWNSGGFGHSNNGVNGPFETAITQDGHIVASFITGLIVSASQVVAGTLKSTNNKLQMNLDTGEFKFESTVVNLSDEGVRVSHLNTNIETVQSDDGFYIKERGKTIEEAKASFNDKGIDTSVIEAESGYFGEVYVNKTVKLYQAISLTYYVNTATGDDSNPGTSSAPFRSFNKAISMIGSYIPTGVTVGINCSGTFNEPIYICNFFGGGTIDVYFNADCVMRQGALLMGNTCRINISGYKTWDGTTGSLFDGTYEGTNIIVVTRCSFVYIKGFRFSNGNVGIRVLDNSYIVIYNLDFATTVYHAIWSRYSIIANEGYRGSPTYAYVIENGSNLYNVGNGGSYVPTGGQEVRLGSEMLGGVSPLASAFSAPPVPPVSTYETTWGMTSGKTKCTNSSDRTDGLLQGYYDSSRGQQRALISFDIANIRNTLKNATINDVQVYAQRLNTAHGTYAGQPVHIWSKNGETAVTKYGTFGSLTQGSGAWLGAGSLVGLGNALRDGNADGVMFYDQNAWSQNQSYVRFEWNVKLWIRYTK